MAEIIKGIHKVRDIKAPPTDDNPYPDSRAGYMVVTNQQKIFLLIEQDDK